MDEKTTYALISQLRSFFRSLSIYPNSADNLLSFGRSGMMELFMEPAAAAESGNRMKTT
jgi:hypothetical protein